MWISEEWAAAKGMWPQMIEAPVPRLPQGVQTDGYGTVPVAMGNLRAPRHNPDYWKFAAAKILHGWPEGKELTEAEFDKAVAAACNQTAR